MPLVPYAKLRASVNSAAVVTGGITCAGGESIALSADPAGALASFKIEIYDYPPEFACPSGWTSVVTATGATNYTCTPSNGVAPVFTLDSAAHWWKYMFRLTGNNRDNGGNANIPVSQLVDESTAITVPAASGIQQIGKNETNQFNADWNVTQQKNLRIVDAIAGATVNASALAPAAVVSIANLASLSGEQTIDSVLTSSSRALLVGQTTSSQNGLWTTAAGAWTRPADFNSDAKVIAGQTVFVTAGTLRASTTWQLKTGSTIAGAKVYAQVVAPTVSPPNDLASTTNVASLSGEQTIDGTLTSVSRVLLVNQTTSSQNGPWVTASGAWARPTDFATDGQVVAGSFFYVKSGTLGTNTTWQMTSGSTLAGAKVFARSLSGASRPAVRAVQTATLPTNTYSAGVITGTAALSTTFDGVSPVTANPLLVGDRVLVVLEGTKNGIYSVTTLGGSSYVLTRATDLNVSAHFSGGVQVDVLDGATVAANNKGTRWAMTTLAAVTLDTTPTTWAPIVPRSVLWLDASAPSYGVVADPAVDISDGLNRAIYDAHVLSAAASPKVRYKVRVPSGVLVKQKPLIMWDDVTLSGAGRSATLFNGTGAQGSPDFWFDFSDPVTLFGTAVDAGAGSTPIAMFGATGLLDETLNFTTANPTMLLEKASSGTLGYSCRFTCRFAAIAAGHIGSTRGRVDFDAPLRVCDAFYLNADGSVNFQLRTISSTAVFGAGSSPPTVTVTGTIPDGYLLTVKADHVGALARGSGATFRYRINDGGWIESGVTIAATVALAGLMTGVTLNFPAGSYTGRATTDPFAAYNNIWENFAVHSLTTTVGKVTSATNYTVHGIFDSSTGAISLYVSTGGVIDAAPVTQSANVGEYVMRTGIEMTVWGSPNNVSWEAGAIDGFSAPYYLGSVDYSITPRTASAATSLARVADANSVLFFKPQTSGALLDGSGAVRGWFASSATGSIAGNTYVMHQRANGSFMQHCGLEHLGRVVSKRPGIAVTTGITRHRFYDLDLNQGPQCMSVIGPAYYGSTGELRMSSTAGSWGMKWIGAELALTGNVVDEGSGIALIAIGCGGSVQRMWIAPSTPPGGIFAFAIILYCTDMQIFDFTIADEGTSGVRGAGLMLSVGTGFTLSIGGGAGLGNARYLPVRMVNTAGNRNGKLRWNMSSFVNNTDRCIFSIADAGVQPIELVRPGLFRSNVPVTIPYCDVAGFIAPSGGAAPFTALADAATTTLTTLLDKTNTRYFMAAGTTTTANAFTLAPGFEGHRVRFAIDIQGNNVSIINGGAGAGTLDTVTAGSAARLEYVWERNRVTGVGNWVHY